MNKEYYNKEISEIKEALTNMPLNNKSNKEKFFSYIKTIIKSYSGIRDDLKDEIVKRNNMICEKEKKHYVDISSYVGEKNEILKKLNVLNNNNSPYEKIGLDKIIDSINRYYEGNLDYLNDKIYEAINCFKVVGVDLTKDDFWYSYYLNNYMDALLNSKGNDEVKNRLNQIYWKSPNIINQISMNLHSLYFKYEKYFIAYYDNEKQNIMIFKSKEKILSDYNILNDEIDNNYYSLYNIGKRFIDGTDNIKDFSEDKYKNYMDSISDVNVEKDNLKKLYYTLYEYSGYRKYQYLIEAFISLYKEKDKYKTSYKNIRKDILKEENKIRKINKKILFQFKWKHDNTKIELLNIQLNTVIESLKEKYNNLEIEKMNEFISKCNDNLSYYDILSLVSSHYIYLKKLCLDNNSEVSDNDICKLQLELTEFLYSDKLNILDNISVLEEENIPKNIVNIYSLLNIKLMDNDIVEGVDNYLEILRKIRIINEINSADISYDELLFQTEIEGILN